jgi:hypothetical protein
MPSYLILIYGDEQRWTAMSPEEERQIHAGHREFQRLAGAAVRAVAELEQSTSAVTLRRGPDGAPVVTDGPFLESKEVVGGFYLVDAADRDEVVSFARELAETVHDHSGVEIIPLLQRS